MAADRADDAGIPPDEPSGGPGDTAIPGRAARAETRGREEYYLSLREKVTAGQRSAAAEEQARTENWNETAELSRQLWTEYRRRWTPETARTASGPWTAPTATGSTPNATASPNANAKRSRRPCVT